MKLKSGPLLRTKHLSHNFVIVSQLLYNIAESVFSSVECKQQQDLLKTWLILTRIFKDKKSMV